MTEFGKELRKLRINNEENMLTMATKLSLSTSTLSMIENGLKEIPDNLVQKIEVNYILTAREKEDLEIAKDKSK
jgi:transcriptional regulator with XRE-family HTH domain